jgi:hypothetical protein
MGTKPEKRPIGPDNLPGAGWYVISLLIPIIGFGLGFYAMTRNLLGPAFAMWTLSLVAGVIGTYLQLR